MLVDRSFGHRVHDGHRTLAAVPTEPSLGLGDLTGRPGQEPEDHEVRVLEPVDCLTECVGGTDEGAGVFRRSVLGHEIVTHLGRVTPVT